jgi:hypothetical protein
MKSKDKKKDEAGAPVEMVEIPAPDGGSVSVPTWIAAALQELEQLRAQAQAPAQPQAPEAPAPVAPAAAPGDAEEEEKEKSEDAILARVRRRARYERLAARAGLEDEKIDGLDDDALAREIVGARIPWAKAKAEAIRGDALDALVSVAAEAPTAQEPEEAPVHYTIPRTDHTEIDDAAVNWLRDQGYEL